MESSKQLQRLAKRTILTSFHIKSPKKSAKLNGSDPDFDESAYIWSL